ncbi:MAG: anthranilate synthase component I [Proteobacteria bacterium]|nr:anthranilate synthase component I [Pseudomonadota bacterium]
MNNEAMTYKEFLKQAEAGDVFPFFREILADLDTPLSCYMKLKDAYPSSPSFLLESVEAKERLGRFSFIGFEPFLAFKSLDNKVFLNGIIEDTFESDNPFLELKEIMNKFKGFGFSDSIARFGGPVGYVGYDVIKFFEKMPDRNERVLDVHDIHFIFPKKLIIFDNYTRRMTLFVFHHAGKHESMRESHAGGIAGLDELQTIVRSPLAFHKEGELSVRMMDSNTTKEEFEEMVLKAKAYIHAGDVIQVVLSQRFAMEISIDNLSLYRALRVVNPSPYMFLLDYLDYSLIGTSPETLVKLEDGEVEVRPIAGTRRRGKDREEDEALAKELLCDEKELAEHTMLVDLGRNDVGRIAAAGSVSVPEFMDIERYSHVMHIVSSVKGQVKEGMDAFDVFQATFPAGTVTGAPKIRAMEIIEELEKEKREFYAGSVGYFTYNGNMDFCITIRTLLKKQNKVYIQAGSGIVADSVPETEYMETIHKSQALIKSIMELKEIID